jgi:hypothetical protein
MVGLVFNKRVVAMIGKFGWETRVLFLAIVIVIVGIIIALVKYWPTVMSFLGASAYIIGGMLFAFLAVWIFRD